MLQIMHNRKYYQKVSETHSQCLLCPNLCKIELNSIGYCGFRENKYENILPRFADQYSSIAIDPLGKKPFFNLNPGENVLSLGSIGCNFRCIHCQNWGISQPHRFKHNRQLSKLTPQEIIVLAKKHNLFIAFTYNEPLINLEAIYETAELAKQNNCKLLLVTNGYINIALLKELVPLIAGFSIDLKAFTKSAYLNLTGIDAFENVKKTIAYLVKQEAHIELTTNLVTDINDDLVQLQEAAKWIYDLNSFIPWHITTFRPMLEVINRKQIAQSFVENAVCIAKKQGLVYVYSNHNNNTYCPHCKKLLIQRTYFQVVENYIENYSCPACKKDIPYMSIYT